MSSSISILAILLMLFVSPKKTPINSPISDWKIGYKDLGNSKHRFNLQNHNPLTFSSNPDRQVQLKQPYVIGDARTGKADLYANFHSDFSAPNCSIYIEFKDNNGMILAEFRTNPTFFLECGTKDGKRYSGRLRIYEGVLNTYSRHNIDMSADITLCP